MNFISNYIQKVGWRRIIIMILGNMIIGIGSSIFRVSQMGNEPFTAMILSLYPLTPFTYPVFQLLLNVAFFVFQMIWGRDMIGIGTIVNWFLLGYFSDIPYQIIMNTIGQPTSLPVQLFMVLLGVLVICFGLSLYQQSDVGIAPFDTLPIILNRKTNNKIPYFWCRMLFDGSCAVIAFVVGGFQFGLGSPSHLFIGSVICAFGLGPFITIYSKTITKKILPDSGKIK